MSDHNEIPFPCCGGLAFHATTCPVDPPKIVASPPPRRRGDWLQTFTGRQFWPLDPRPEDIDVRDIAHALARQCRFSGHCRSFYSVAEHSIRVARLVPAEHQLWGLLHDASEAYLVDLPRPLKRLPEFAPYREAEARVMACICERFGLPVDEPAEVRHADAVLLATEARDLMERPPAPWAEMPTPLARPVLPWGDYRGVEAEFLGRFDDLMAERRVA